MSNFFSQYSTNSAGNVINSRAGTTIFHINGVHPDPGAGNTGQQNAFLPYLSNPAVVGPAGLAFNPTNFNLYVSSYSATNPVASTRSRCSTAAPAATPRP